MARSKNKSKPNAAKPRRSRGKPIVAASHPVEILECEPCTDACPPLQPTTAVVELPACMDASAAAGVRDILIAARGAPVEVDASHVRRVGAQSLQVLIAASRSWRAAGHAYAIVKPSSELIDTIKLLGIPSGELSLGELCQ